ncbi:unnamed protein product, partial [Cyprideis torosa]
MRLHYFFQMILRGRSLFLVLGFVVFVLLVGQFINFFGAPPSIEGQESNSEKQRLPSLKSEVARRRVEKDVDELWYFLSSTLKKLEGSETGPMLSKTKDR